MAHPPQQPDFDPNQRPPQAPPMPPETGGRPLPQPESGAPPPAYGAVPPGYGPSPGYGAPLPMPPKKPRTGMVFGILIGSMALIIIGGLLIGQMSGDDGPSSSDSPEAVVEQFAAAMASLTDIENPPDAEEVVETIGPYFCGELLEEMRIATEEDTTASASEADMELLEGMEIRLDFESVDSTVEGDTATVEGYFIFTVIDTEENTSNEEETFTSIELVREDDTWLICDLGNDIITW